MGIYHDENNHVLALINDRILTHGDYIDEYKIKNIFENEVILSQEDNLYKLQLFE